MDVSPRSIHFLGICGTAMASVAALLKEKGYAVSGSDENVYPPMPRGYSGKWALGMTSSANGDIVTRTDFP